MRARSWLLAGLLLAVGCSSGTEDVNLNNPYDNAGFPVPDSVIVTLGSNVVRLDWSVDSVTTVNKYTVFRRRTDTDPPEAERVVATVSSRTYTDYGVRDGRTYLYRIAAGKDGHFGARSEGIEARPAFFAISLAGGAPRTRLTNVIVSPTGPVSVTAIQLGEVADLNGAVWLPVTGNLVWILSNGDGTKRVYARMRISDGATSFPVFADIALDTHAIIRNLDFDGADVRAPGDILHVRLDAGEPSGTASVSIGTLFTNLALLDDGSGGDTSAGDGVYERDVVLPYVVINQINLTGRFTDLVGNDASPLSGPRTLTVGTPPAAVSLLSTETAVPPDAPSVTIRWTQSLDTSFRSYRVYRSDDANVDTTDRLAGEVTTATTAEFEDTDVIEGQTYYYRVFVRNQIGLETGSAMTTVTVPNVRPPAAVTLNTPDGISDSRLALKWSKTTSEDFSAYRVYRNETGAVTEQDPMVAEIHNVEQVYFDDLNLVENTLYYYRVVVVDQAGLTTRSNEVQARTANLPPPPVTLAPGTNLSFTAATLSWSASDVHDFASYKLFRDTVSSVTTGSTLVIELKDREALAYRDTALVSGHTYYYRVYVVDDGVNPGPEQSGSNVITVTTP
jgi:hypothetical protein